MRTACFTICSRNYLAYALTLRESLLAVEPDRNFYIFLADAPLDDPSQLPGVVAIPAADLNLPDFQSMAFRYSIMEFNTAIKPFCFEHLFKKLHYEAAIYLDPDIQVFRSLTRVHDALESGASCVLTPHILSPLDDELSPSDIDILRSGTFNLGFAAFRQSPEAEAFISWWARRLADNCFNDIEHGLFVDQKFVEFAPSFIPSLHVLTDPGHNVAYWNLTHRPIRKQGDMWTAGGAPLVFFHFSGVSPGSPNVFSKHQSRFDMTNIGDAAELVRNYTASLADNGHAHWSALPYAFGQFANGERILDAMRGGPPADPSNPFREPNHAWWNAPTERVDQLPGLTITRLMYAIHAGRPDLRDAFPLSTAAGQRGFHAWFITHGAQEYHIGETSLAAAMAASAIRNRLVARLFARFRLGFARAL
jgi:hypothetical protein